MKIERSKAEALFEALGMKDPSKLSDLRLGKRMTSSVPSVVEEEEIPDINEATDGLLTAVLDTIEQGEAITIVADAPEIKVPKRKKVVAKTEEAPAPPKRKKKKTAAKKEPVPKPSKPPKRKKKVAAKVQSDDAITEPKPPKRKKKAAKKATVAKDAPAKPVGVREGRTRMRVAGQVIAKYGLEPGVTDTMVAEVDKLYESANPVQSRQALVTAWHIVYGYKQGNGN